ncbi:MAG TPA: O-methyltransferase [Lachnospiraceae bacterium]|nr:O-methyltransferase [uncultured Lachnoclostridium sp.]HAU85378.1 O-methyltransferase [Lachnospiraceae bacterium]
MITNERIATYIDSLDKELPEFLRQLEKKALSEYVPIIKKPTQSLLRFLIQNNKPGQILEVGTAVGFSSIFMSQFIGDNAHITTIEKMEKRIIEAKENRKKAGKEEQITILEGDASVILKELKEKKNIYDMIFMDAAKGQYLNFLPDIFDLLTPGGLLISDNVLQDGDIIESRYAVTRRNRTIHCRMREYLYELTHSESFETVVLPIGDGVMLSTKLVK